MFNLSTFKKNFLSSFNARLALDKFINAVLEIHISVLCIQGYNWKSPCANGGRR